MRAIPSVCLAAVAAGLLLLPRSAAAQAQPDASALQQQIDQLKKEFGERIAALEAKLANAQAAAPAPTPDPVAPAPAAATSGAKVFNPDMAVIGNFLGAAGQNDVNPSPALEMPESEASFQAIVDPYARADFFLAFGEEGVELEEGFVTFTDAARRLCKPRSARCARRSARSTRCTPTCCRGPTGRSSPTTWSAAKRASAMRACRWRG